MPYTLTTLDDGHIIVATIGSDFDAVNDMLPMTLGCYDLLDHGPDRVVIISDARELRLKSANEVILSANVMRTPESKRVREHPKLLRNFAVINNNLLQMIVKGLNSASFGYVEATIFETLDDAISHARALIASEDKAN
jgi:hypothetical protein